MPRPKAKRQTKTKINTDEKSVEHGRYVVPLPPNDLKRLNQELPGLHEHLTNGCALMGHDALVANVRADIYSGNDYWTQVLAVAGLKFLETKACCENKPPTVPNKSK
jgi:hypothetical protein